MTQKIASELEAAVAEASARLRAITEATAAHRAREGQWTAKEIVGHLIDSAANNHHRFVRAQQGRHELVFPAYQQNDWVSLQAHQERPWPELIELWALYNRHLAHVIRRIPEASLTVLCRIGANEPVTLGFMIEDYLGHLRHHLRQIEERVAR